MAFDTNPDHYLYYSEHMTTEQRYQSVIRKALADIYAHLEEMIESIDSTHLDTTDPQQLAIVEAVRAVEEEWIVDIEQRRELSLLDDIH